MKFLLLISAIFLLALGNITRHGQEIPTSQNTALARQQSASGYISINSTYGQLYLLRDDGSSVTKLIDFETRNAQEVIYEVVWSPDASQVALEVTGTGCPCIYLMNADGSKLRKLTEGPNDQGPAWSPDGKKIAFSRRYDDVGDNFQIYVMGVDGIRETQLTSSSGNSYGPRWSPDGKRIVYDSNPSPQDPFLFQMSVMQADGSNPRQLTDGEFENDGPQWSPDGKQLSFASSRDGHWQVYAMNSDGTNQRNLSKSEFDDMPLEWSPDGKFIAFMRCKNLNKPDYQNIGAYIVSLDSSSITRIEERESTDFIPNFRVLDLAWSPDGKRIALLLEDEVHGDSIYIADVTCLNSTKACSSVHATDFIGEYKLYKKMDNGLGTSLSWILIKN